MFSYSPIDRQGHVRTDACSIRALWQGEESRTLLWHDGRFIMGERQPRYFSYSELQVFADLLNKPVYLGQHQAGHFFACRLKQTVNSFDEQQYQSLRSASRFVGDYHLGLMFYSQGVLNWLQNHAFCSRCGSDTRIINAGHARQCNNDECAKILYPKIDPAVIFSVINNKGPVSKILLGRQKAWDANRYSVIAGFVEPGETLENAVRREAQEETGLAVDKVEYVASQAWPFPDSLMLGFSCESSQKTITLVDQELDAADWFSADELETQVRTKNLKLPFEVSISRYLIDRWFIQQTGHSLGSL